MHSISTWWMWVGFFIFVATVLAIDTFFIGGKKSHRVTTREALSWTIVWVSCALIFNLLLWLYLFHTQTIALANQKSLEFFTGYLIEESLSVDNLFVFLTLFNYFSVPHEYQRRVLLYGVWSAIILRLLMILFGTWLIHEFHWILYLFGIFLFFTGIKMLVTKETKRELSQNPFVIWLRKHLRMTDRFHDEHFFIRQNALWYATPLFLVLILIEVGDVVFALDSIPAIFAITNDPFIVFTSNIFAILGLRAMYFLLAHLASRFYLLKYAIALMLAFIGLKMLLAAWIHIPILIALSVVAAILGTTIILSLLGEKKTWKS